MAYDAAMPDLHPDVAVLAPLLGTWEGAGAGEYPTIEDFAYRESSTFGHVGKPFLAYSQKTVADDDGRPLHSESGYVRVPVPGRVELVLAHPTGLTEIGEGTIEETDAGFVIDVRSSSIGASASAKDVTIAERTIEVADDRLTYSFRMAAVGRPLLHHLAAELRRIG